MALRSRKLDYYGLANQLYGAKDWENLSFLRDNKGDLGFNTKNVLRFGEFLSMF